LKVTPVTFTKFAPEIVTAVPIAPALGLNVAITGAVVTVKLPALVAVPLGVMTVILPLTVPGGTTTVIWVAELTTNEVVDIAPKLTLVVPARFAPISMTLVPALPLDGGKLVIAGPVTIPKLIALAAVPPGVVTEMAPVVAFAGTVAEICVAESTLKTADTPLNFTACPPLNFVPVMVTADPIMPFVGANPVIVGCPLVEPPCSNRSAITNP